MEGPSPVPDPAVRHLGIAPGSTDPQASLNEPAADVPVAEPVAASDGDDEQIAGPSILDAGLKGLCPRCGKPTLFGGHWIKFADRCAACGLDIGQFNVGDGPAAFLTLILGTIVTAAAIVVELTVHPPLWVHMLIWIPVTLAAVIWSLRLAKGALLAAEYRNAAREGRIAKP